MRFLLSSLLGCLAVAAASVAFAQDEPAVSFDSQSSPEKTTAATPVKKRMPRIQPRYTAAPETVARLLHERAMTQARSRRARIEARKWAGVSLMRPTVVDYAPLPGDDWRAPAGSPWWWSTASSHLRMGW